MFLSQRFYSPNDSPRGLSLNPFEVLRLSVIVHCRPSCDSQASLSKPKLASIPHDVHHTISSKGADSLQPSPFFPVDTQNLPDRFRQISQSLDGSTMAGASHASTILSPGNYEFSVHFISLQLLESNPSPAGGWPLPPRLSSTVSQNRRILSRAPLYPRPGCAVSR